MLGGSDVVIASRCFIGTSRVRGRLWRQQLVTFHCALTDAIADPNAGADAGWVVDVRLDSCRRGLFGGSSLYARPAERRGWHDGHVDEYRCDFPHVDIECDRVGLGNTRTRRTVLVYVPERGNISVPLRDSSRNGRNGRRQLMQLARS
jgi:hypothetical protein